MYYRNFIITFIFQSDKMKHKDIIDAWVWVRSHNHDIPDDVLDFMKDCAIAKLDEMELERERQLDRETEFKIQMMNFRP